MDDEHFVCCNVNVCILCSPRKFALIIVYMCRGVYMSRACRTYHTLYRRFCIGDVRTHTHIDIWLNPSSVHKRTYTTDQRTHRAHIANARQREWKSKREKEAARGLVCMRTVLPKFNALRKTRRTLFVYKQNTHSKVLSSIIHIVHNTGRAHSFSHFA